VRHIKNIYLLFIVELFIAENTSFVDTLLATTFSSVEQALEQVHL
jgi:hypothetical protein